MIGVLLVSLCGWLWEGLCCCVFLCAILEGHVTASLGDPVSVCDYGILYDSPEEEEGLYLCV